MTHLNYCPAGGQLSSSLSPLLGQLEGDAAFVEEFRVQIGLLDAWRGRPSAGLTQLETHIQNIESTRWIAGQGTQNNVADNRTQAH